MLEGAVQALKDTIVEHDGSNAADRIFSRRVDELVSLVYDDIDRITTVPTRVLFDLFVIKVLYVGRRSTDAGVVDYLSGLLDRYLYTRELYPPAGDGEAASLMYFSDLLREIQQTTHAQNMFEAYRKYGDNALFVTGMFPRAARPPRRRRMARVTFVDRAYYVSTGKQSYQLAARHELAEATQQRDLLAKLSSYFEIYLEALNEMSERYIMGFDFNLIADKMLDSFNEYRRSGDERLLQNARRYAALLRLDPSLELASRPGQST